MSRQEPGRSFNPPEGAVVEVMSYPYEWRFDADGNYESSVVNCTKVEGGPDFWAQVFFHCGYNVMQTRIIT